MTSPAAEPAAGGSPGRALVTGGGRGIGAAVVERLAANGYDVAIGYRKDASSAEDVAQRVRVHGVRSMHVHVDLGCPESVPQAVDEVVGPWGGLEVVVNSGGAASSGRSVAETEVEEVTRQLAVHAVGPHALARAALPALRRSGRGRLVFVSSVVTGTSMAQGAPYVMGKSAVEALASVLAREERPHGIRVHVVAPGLVRTEMGRRLVRATQDADIDELASAAPFGRLCEPADVAASIAFLVSPAADYLTDQRIVIDGGTF